jgi:two-component system alkaline phosphatase synthesis response regulator PhoP
MKHTKVLIIDDEKETARYLTTVLQQNGFTDIHTAYDGEQGLDKAREVLPGLILLDLRMPKKSGIHVFNELKQSPEFREVPFIILTGEGGFLKHLAELRNFHEGTQGLEEVPTEEVLDRFISQRPEGFLEKPIEADVLIRTVKKVLITLDEVKEERYGEINELRAEKLNQGVIFKGLSFESDEKSRNSLSGAAASATLPSNFVWRSSENESIPMNKNKILEFHSAMTRWVFENYRVSWDHKTFIDTLTSIEDVESYAIEEGWPSNAI